MSNLMSLSIRTLIYGSVIFSAILVSGVAVNYALAGSPDAENEGVAVEDVEAKIQAAVDAGEITQEQADEKLEGWNKDQAEGLKAREDSRRITLEDVEARLKAGVDAGGLTQEQADERLEAWKKDPAEGLKAREDVRKIAVEDVQAEIQAVVESGEITQEQADEKLAWLEANQDSSWKDIVADSR